ncbi:hypothetical protein COY15_02280 [Candidatus Roizmanbacteria bacterium CG_4_10_14_0_2_um_filter_39_12]|nr:MAG: hypothetical protein COY15_02280 [Candidatus Roizmanbacteria bacterium CG_4_10_14_0_2_um_filter_39_12]
MYYLFQKIPISYLYKILLDRKLVIGISVITFCLLPFFQKLQLQIYAVEDITAPITTIDLSGTKSGEIYTSNVVMTLTATDHDGGLGVEWTKYQIDNSGSWLFYNGPETFSKSKEYTIKYFSKDKEDNEEKPPQEKSFTIVLPTLTPVPSTPTPVPNTPIPSSTPTYAPTPVPNTPTPTASPTPEVSPPQGMIGPPAPQLQQQDSQQQMQQQEQNGDVKSAFSNESGPDSIGDAPGSGTAGVIKIFVTVIALTISGVVGWMAIKSNAKVEVEEGSE